MSEYLINRILTMSQFLKKNRQVEQDECINLLYISHYLYTIFWSILVEKIDTSKNE